jgi:hypothetical protein
MGEKIMGDASPVAPHVLQDLLLADRACRRWAEGGAKVELWEAFSLARADRDGLAAEVERGAGAPGSALLERLSDVRRDTGPLLEFLRPLLLTVLPQPPQPGALDLALVFVMTSPPARASAARWSQNPQGSREEATKMLRVMARIVEGYRQAMIDASGGPAPAAVPAAPAGTESEADRLIRERIEAQRKSQTERRTREKAEAERKAREQAEAERAARERAEAEQKAQEHAEAERKARERAEEERAARERAEAERIAREKAEAERKAHEKAEAERIAREKAEAERKAREKAEAERIAREKAEAEHIAREKAEAERKAREKAEAERVAREKAEAERKAREKAEAERVAREKAEAERVAREKAEAERVAREKAEAERKAREKAEAERVAREKAEAERVAREKAEAERVAREREAAERAAREQAEAEARLSPEEKAAREELRKKVPAALADPWREQKVGAWFRVKTVSGGQETYTDTGLRERGAGFSVLGVQQQIGGRPEWERWERTEPRTVELLGQEMVDLGGTRCACDVYQVHSRAGDEKVWILLDGPHAGTPVRWDSPTASFQARKLEKETVPVGPKSFDCVRAEGEETAGGKKTAATRWWSAPFPLGPVKSEGGSGSSAAVHAGDNWNNRPPFPA